MRSRGERMPHTPNAGAVAWNDFCRRGRCLPDDGRQVTGDGDHRPVRCDAVGVRQGQLRGVIPPPDRREGWAVGTRGAEPSGCRRPYRCPGAERATRASTAVPCPRAGGNVHKVQTATELARSPGDPKRLRSAPHDQKRDLGRCGCARLNSQVQCDSPPLESRQDGPPNQAGDLADMKTPRQLKCCNLV